jgi:hypothetical protein
MRICDTKQVVHGLSIPLGRVGYLAPRTLSRVISESLSDAPQPLAAKNPFHIIGRLFRGRMSQSESGGRTTHGPSGGVLGVANDLDPASSSVPPRRITISSPFQPRRIHRGDQGSHGREREQPETANQATPTREIRFFDEVIMGDRGPARD